MGETTKWKPGMWEVAGPDLPKCVVVTDAPTENLLVINETAGLAEFPTTEAATLCAAAPDLYAALEETRSMLDAMPRAHNSHSWDTVKDCRACEVTRVLRDASSALARARGETK